jgi:hypothetical protein
MAQGRKLIGILTGAVLDCGPQPWWDFSHPWVVCNCRKTKQKVGVGRVAPQLDFGRKYIKTSFFDVMSEVLKVLEDFSAGMDF